MDFKNQNKCPSCENSIDKQLKLKLLKNTEIRCPYCANDLRISESKAFLVTTPLFALFAFGLHKYTDMSNEMALVAIVTFVAVSYYPSRSIEILLTKLKLVKH